MVLIGRDYTCHDLLFSGHTVVITLYCLFFCRYTKSSIFKLLMLTLGIVALFLIVSTRFHYSSDVLYGMLISYVGFIIYHSLVDEIHETLMLNQIDQNLERKNFFDVGIYNQSNIIKRIVVIFIVWHESFDHLIKRDGTIVE